MAMLAGMLLALFTPFVRAGLLTVNGECFGNTPEADARLVRGRAGYLGGSLGTTSRRLRVRFAPTHRWVNMTSPLCPMLTLARSLEDCTEGLLRLVSRPGFAAFKSLLDVGGGLRVSIAARNAIPCLSAIIVELPRIAALLGLLMPCFQVVSESRRMMS